MAEDLKAGGAESVDYSDRERGFGADHGQVNAVGKGESL